MPSGRPWRDLALIAGSGGDPQFLFLLQHPQPGLDRGIGDQAHRVDAAFHQEGGELREVRGGLEYTKRSHWHPQSC